MGAFNYTYTNLHTALSGREENRAVFYGTGKDITADEYLEDAENPVQRASNMQKILQWMEMYENEFRQ